MKAATAELEPRLPKRKRALRDCLEDKRLDRSVLSLAERLWWFALIVIPQEEFKVQKQLRMRGVKTFVPLRTEWRKRNKYSKEKTRQTYTLIPGYVFAGFPTLTPPWYYLRSELPITAVVGFNGIPVPLPTLRLVDFMKRHGGGWHAEDTQKYMITHKEFKAGDMAEVIGGPFTGMRLPVKTISGDKATVLLELFGGAVEEVPMPIRHLQAAQ